MVPIPDDTLQGMFVRLYIENGPQVHLEICSVLVTRADSFSPQDLCVPKTLMDTHCGPQSIPIIDAMPKLEPAPWSSLEAKMVCHHIQAAIPLSNSLPKQPT